MKINKFEDLEVWKASMSITKDIYELSKNGEFGRDFGLRDQIRRAVVSISSNIVEGFEKNNNNEFIRFLKIAKGSAGETRNQLYIAQILEYITKIQQEELDEKLMLISSQIGKFISYLENKRKEKQFLTR